MTAARRGGWIVTGTAVMLGLAACGEPSASEPQAAPASVCAAGTSTTTPRSPSTSTSTADPGEPAFPLHVDTSGRFLRDADEQPFLLHGDTAWSLIAQLRDEDVDRYLADRRERGFNTILVNLIEHEFASNAPANIYGDPPFEADGDFSRPNEAYFEHAESVLQRAQEQGFLVLLTPAYIGYRDSGEGFYDEMDAAGPEVLEGYGRYVAERFSGLDNIVWVQGGDDNPPDASLVDAIANGIEAVDPDALQTAHGAPETAAFDVVGERPWLDLNNIYTYKDVYPVAIEQFSADRMPFFLLESTYENEHDATTELIRAQAYYALLAGAMGQVFGNNPIWHFDAPGLFEVDVTWQDALGEPGSQSMTHLRGLLDPLEWWKLDPDLDHRFLTDDGDSGGTVGSIACDGSFGLVYVPAVEEVTVDLSTIEGDCITLRWYDPSAGTFTSAGQVTATDEPTVVTPPGPNAEGSADWVLLAQGR
jgi:uncharacterized protein DUF4038/collagenase-like protein with putative collagen-binding domain